MKLSGKERLVNEDDKQHVTKRAKIDKRLSLNGLIYEEQFKTEFKQVFRSEKDFNYENETFFSAHPFKHCVLKNFVKDTNFLENLKTELLGLQFETKSNDLYKFAQSNLDLKTSTAESISELRKLLYKDFLEWIKYITDIPLDENAIDMSCAKYSNTDVLLCHDDELEGRRIAYILYLVPCDWTKDDGGCLDLFTTDQHGQPDEIVKSLVPEWNSLVYFEVTPKSFHQVSEVISDKTRLSISGWLHGPNIIRPSPFKELPSMKQPPLHLKDEVLISWINPLYLQTEIVEEIRQSFEDNSEVELQDFFLQDKYDDLIKALSQDKLRWRMRGPANKRHYEVGIEDSLTGIVQECCELFKSEPMFRLLTTLTGLKLSDVDIESEKEETDESEKETSEKQDIATKSEQTTDENEVTPSITTYSCHGDVCRWSHGCYTLVHDTDPEVSQMALDCMFFISSDGWQEEFGGYTSYLAREEDEELLTVHPCSNSLALVYRDTETLKFVKHINNRCRSQEEKAGSSTSSEYYYNLMFTYFE